MIKTLAKNKAKKLLKKGAKAILKKVLIWLSPYLTIFFIIIICIAILMETLSKVPIVGNAIAKKEIGLDVDEIEEYKDAIDSTGLMNTDKLNIYIDLEKQSYSTSNMSVKGTQYKTTKNIIDSKYFKEADKAAATVTPLTVQDKNDDGYKYRVYWQVLSAIDILSGQSQDKNTTKAINEAAEALKTTYTYRSQPLIEKAYKIQEIKTTDKDGKVVEQKQINTLVEYKVKRFEKASTLFFDYIFEYDNVVESKENVNKTVNKIKDKNQTVTTIERTKYSSPKLKVIKKVKNNRLENYFAASKYLNSNDISYIYHMLTINQEEMDPVVIADINEYFNDSPSNNINNVNVNEFVSINDFKGSFMWAVPKYYRISSPFGWRIHPKTHQRSLHKGIDIPAPPKTPIYAAENGVVIFAGWAGAYGYQVLVDHGGGYISQYAHNSVMIVKKGQKVKKGQLVSLMGNTGWSTGPHLHFGIKKNGQWINPAPILKK